jgi:DNA helicase HerA-like ATPase
MKWLAEASQGGAVRSPLLLEVAALTAEPGVPVRIVPERIFGRHCAVLGATGGGKSWTVARLIEEVARYQSKTILLDATGEFHTLGCNVRHVYIGTAPDPAPGATEVVVPYKALTESDLFALLKPSGLTQAPKLRMAIKSLKLAALEPSLAEAGVIRKAGRAREAFDAACRTHATAIEHPRAMFDIRLLASQVEEECVFPTDQKNPSYWGRVSESDRSYCVSLITRIDDILSSESLACVFRTEGKPSLRRVINEFLESDVAVLRISLKHLPFDHNAREIVANAIGRALLTDARNGAFRNRPLIVVLDEAHQFLNKTLGDENTKYPLDSFDLIAKEGRKFCLNLCLATQRPRDIPEGVLSQMGTLVVHRLTNDKDREVVERASGDIDRSAAAFLPTLAPGEAVIIGADFPIPLTIQVSPPVSRPDSTGPDYQRTWSEREVALAALD